MANDANSIVRLYEDCIRGDDGIRYRRSGTILGKLEMYPRLEEEPNISFRSLLQLLLLLEKQKAISTIIRDEQITNKHVSHGTSY